MTATNWRARWLRALLVVAVGLLVAAPGAQATPPLQSGEYIMVVVYGAAFLNFHEPLTWNLKVTAGRAITGTSVGTAVDPAYVDSLKGKGATITRHCGAAARKVIKGCTSQTYVVQSEAAGIFSGTITGPGVAPGTTFRMQPTFPFAPTTPATPAAPKTPRTVQPATGELGPGDTGSAVKDLQEALRKLGFKIAKVDGTYGPDTRAAVAAFEKAHGLPVDGIDGPTTAARIKAALSSGEVKLPQTGELGPADTGAAVKDLQQALARLGFKIAKADGTYGPDTKAAVAAFEKAWGLPADGVVGAETAQKLNAALAAGEMAVPTSQTIGPADAGTAAVKDVQTALAKLGFKVGKADGAYGLETTAAVLAFQKANGLPPDGVVGPETAARINAALSSGEIVLPPPPEIGPTAGAPSIKDLQEALTKLGFKIGKLDGTWGSDTRAAVVAFERANGLPADGVVGPQTAALINAALSADQVVLPPPSDLGPADSGLTVKSLQQALTKLGFKIGKLDGTYGSDTRAAVVAFERAHGLPADGVVGPQTAALINAALPSAEVALPPPEIGPTAGAPSIKDLQQALTKLGFKIGKLDGTYGSDTRAAVVAFERAHGLPADGVVGPDTAAKINAALSSGELSLPTSREIGPADTGAAVIDLQQALTKLGFKITKADGSYGRDTQTAVAAFQKAHGLPADGLVGPQTAARINAALAG